MDQINRASIGLPPGYRANVEVSAPENRVAGVFNNLTTNILSEVESKRPVDVKQRVADWIEDCRYSLQETSMAVQKYVMDKWDAWFPKAVKQPSEHLTREIAHNTLPAMLMNLITDLIQTFQLKRFLEKNPKLKTAFYNLSTPTIKYALKYAGRTVEFGLNNLVTALRIPLDKSTEEKEKILAKMEGDLLQATTTSLANVNAAFEQQAPDTSESEKTVNVLTHLQEKGQLHEAIEILSVEEEQLWSERGEHLAAQKPGESISDTITRLTEERDQKSKEIVQAVADPNRDVTQLNSVRNELTAKIETLTKIKAIEDKLWAKESAYLTKIATELFEKVLFPDDSFKEQLPIGLRPYADTLKQVIITGLTAVLYNIVDNMANPETLYQGIIDSQQPAGAEQAEAVKAKPAQEPESHTIKPIAEGNIYPLAQAVAGIGFPALEGQVQSAQSVGKAVVGMAKTGVDYAAGYTAYLFPQWTAQAQSAMQTAEQVVQTDPRQAVEQFVSKQVLHLHEQALELCGDHLEVALAKGIGALESMSKPTAPPSTPEKKLSLQQKEEKAKQVVEHAVTEAIDGQIDANLGTGYVGAAAKIGAQNLVLPTVVAGTNATLHRFSNARINRQMMYPVLDAFIANIKTIS